MSKISFIITSISGLSTMLGFLFIYTNKNKDKTIKTALAFASGTMFSASIFDLIPESIKILNKSSLKINTYPIILLCITLGAIIPYIINKYIKNNNNELYRVGILTMITIIIHNIPEGILTYISTTSNIKLGISIALAIALHNIPEGISIAIPIYYGTNNKQKAFIYTLISGISELIGAIIAHAFIKPIITNELLGIIMATVAGIMSIISITELLPNALKRNKKIETVFYFFIGIIFMYISINLIN